MVTITKEEAGDTLPPAYTQTYSTASVASQDEPPVQPPPPAPSSSSTPTQPLSPPTNYLNISRPNASIKGTYTIDPSMPMPGVEPPLDADGNKLNMRLDTKNGSINSIVELIRGPDAKGPARFQTTSHNGAVTLTVHDKRQNRFRLLATSANGAVTLRIPSTFEGPVSTMLKNGKLTFTPAVQARLTTFSENGPEGRYYIGDYAGSGYEGDETWTKDAVRVEDTNGSVKIAFADEIQEATSDRKGFFSRFME